MPYADPEKKKQKDKEYRESHREYFRAKAKVQYEQNREKRIRQVKEWNIRKRSKVIG